MNEEFLEALKEIVKEKGISEDLMFITIEDALVSAYKKNYAGPNSAAANVKVIIDREDGSIKVLSQKLVVEEVFDNISEIDLEDARLINPTYDLDDVVDFEVTPKDFGRVAAQLAKGVVTQRIREAERNIVYKEYKEFEHSLITGIVLRQDKDKFFVNVGKIETVVGKDEQIKGERFGNLPQKVKLYVVEVKETTKGAQVILSRTHPGLVKKLFELEVPEIAEGIVEIKNISREAGSRSKIAVISYDEDIDPMGACVGAKGTRVQNIVTELKGEKIDIIKWSENPEEFISSALSPAKVISVKVNEKEKSAKVVVDDNQLSLAIGKSGQNVRLAAKLTNWKIDIKSKTQAKELNELKEENLCENLDDELSTLDKSFTQEEIIDTDNTDLDV